MDGSTNGTIPHQPVWEYTGQVEAGYNDVWLVRTDASGHRFTDYLSDHALDLLQAQLGTLRNGMRAYIRIELREVTES